MTFSIFKSKATCINKALTGAAICCGLSQAASAVEIAPYFHSWGGSMVEAKQSRGMNSAMLAFAVTRGSCAMDAGLQDKLPDARNYVAAGGRLYVSFGGDAGMYAEIACKDDNQLFNMMERVIIDSGSRRFDFDIEGPQLLNTEGTARRARVLARLQDRYPDLYISFSLPAWLRGFNADSMNLLRTTINAGVRIDRVNAMVMSFGVANLRTMVVPSTVAQASIVAFRASASQVGTLFPNKTQAQLHAMMGMTPMIGRNDDGSVFTLADAQTVANFAKLNGVGMISYWAFQRDTAASSGVGQSAYQFHNIFKTADGFSASPPVSGPAPAPAAGSCSAASWVQGRQYAVGSKVSYSNSIYIARFANPGYNPTVSTYFWSRYFC
ncbi:MAG: hypothetical protein JWR60_3547 [Polaromonas sp.]|nr:hypothetical protein [Polaromonas sp.]